jgi:hypothetical protein
MLNELFKQYDTLISESSKDDYDTKIHSLYKTIKEILMIVVTRKYTSFSMTQSDLIMRYNKDKQGENLYDRIQLALAYKKDNEHDDIAMKNYNDIPRVNFYTDKYNTFYSLNNYGTARVLIPPDMIEYFLNLITPTSKW